MNGSELVIVFFVSNDKQHWTPLEREFIPEWLRDETIIDRMIAGECVRNIESENRAGMRWFTATAVDRLDIQPSSIILPPRLLVPTIVL